MFGCYLMRDECPTQTVQTEGIYTARPVSVTAQESRSPLRWTERKEAVTSPPVAHLVPRVMALSRGEEGRETLVEGLAGILHRMACALDDRRLRLHLPH